MVPVTVTLAFTLKPEKGICTKGPGINQTGGIVPSQLHRNCEDCGMVLDSSDADHVPIFDHDATRCWECSKEFWERAADEYVADLMVPRQVRTLVFAAGIGVAVFVTLWWLFS